MYALDVLAYGTRHHDITLMDKAAVYTVDIPPQKVFAALTPDAFLAWVRRISTILFLSIR
jgi:hypothetical protein